jgi:hypothetical protein
MGFTGKGLGMKTRAITGPCIKGNVKSIKLKRSCRWSEDSNEIKKKSRIFFCVWTLDLIQFS